MYKDEELNIMGPPYFKNWSMKFLFCEVVTKIRTALLWFNGRVSNMMLARKDRANRRKSEQKASKALGKAKAST